MQFSIFHSIAESRINDLVRLLNDDLKPKEHFKLVSVDNLPDNLILLTVSNGKGYLVNIVNQDGDTPENYTANWRSVSFAINEFGNEIPEVVLRIRVSELNQELRNQGKSWEEIEEFWDEVFKSVKK